jgi:hypothetical protein
MINRAEYDKLQKESWEPPRASGRGGVSADDAREVQHATVGRAERPMPLCSEQQTSGSGYVMICFSEHNRIRIGIRIRIWIQMGHRRRKTSRREACAVP